MPVADSDDADFVAVAVLDRHHAVAVRSVVASHEVLDVASLHERESLAIVEVVVRADMLQHLGRRSAFVAADQAEVAAGY